MGLAALNRSNFTYADYLTWDENQRWEIIDGEAYNMTPAPLTVHQTITSELIRQLGNQLLDKACQVIPAPFDVRLPLKGEKEDQIMNVVQPDISVVCDKKKLDRRGCLGAPDLVIEILSPSTSRKDRLEKFNLYERAGVNQYWLVSPEGRMVEIFKAGSDGKYQRPHFFVETDTVKLVLTSGQELSIDLSLVFPKSEEKEEPINYPNKKRI